MKISRRQLRRIIKEEKSRLLKESGWVPPMHRDKPHPLDSEPGAAENAAYEQLEKAFQNGRKVLGANLLMQRLEDFIQTLEEKG